MNPPAEEIVRRAVGLIVDGVRLDTSAFAQELGISRTTLFRRVGNREDLLGEALHYMSERTWASLLRDWQQRHGDAVRSDTGELRSLGVMRGFRSAIAGNQGFRRFLDDEPTLAVRLITDPTGAVQPGVIAAHVELLRRDVEDGGFVTTVSLDSLGYAVVRLGEAFLYSDVLAARPPDLDAASTLLAALVEGQGVTRVL